MFKSIPFVCDFIVRVFVFIIFCEPQMAIVIANTFWSSNEEKAIKHFIIGLLDCEVTEEHNVLYISCLYRRFAYIIYYGLAFAGFSHHT